MSEADKRYNDYSKQYEFLSAIEQTYYRAYEKTIIMLSSAFLAFSLSFLGLIQRNPAEGNDSFILTGIWIMVSAWLLFALSVIAILCSYLTNAIATRRQAGDLEYLIKGRESDDKSKDRAPPWTIASCALYAIAGIAFLTGVVALVIFCVTNLSNF